MLAEPPTAHGMVRHQPGHVAGGAGRGVCSLEIIDIPTSPAHEGAQGERELNFMIQSRKIDILIWTFETLIVIRAIICFQNCTLT